MTQMMFTILLLCALSEQYATLHLRNGGKARQDIPVFTSTGKIHSESLMGSIIRKTIFDQLDPEEAEKQQHISDQVEPLIKKMIRHKMNSGFQPDPQVPSKDEQFDKEKLLGKIEIDSDNNTNSSLHNQHSITQNGSTIFLSKENTKKIIVTTAPQTVDQSMVDDEDAGNGGTSGASGDFNGAEVEGSGEGKEGSAEETTTTTTKTPELIYQKHTLHTQHPKIPYITEESGINWNEQSTFPGNKIQPTTKPSIMFTTPIPRRTYFSEKRIDLHYYGPCVFCKSTRNLGHFQKEMKRKQFRSVLLSYDFAFLVQKHPSGAFTTVLSFGLGHTSFPLYLYLDIHSPLSCSCFTEAANTRYILAGSKYAGKLILNAFYPLYAVDSYKDIEDIQEILKIGRNIVFGKV